ncbi:hypothetical protein H6G94_01225 [Nostoc punctiforme FACHB-252]|jgi:hypothetical protein|uniref:Uncharacterized protein n=1 Tax=Nostoc punctiforme FACHB-252 TaxID=1357509 RepID=A0ABR8H337_NOSPU|nr:hypothetical protein [Nostoc punctiforme]MBD2609909.1 hypothetical protein [Nostoc punctiforme FACHB-252]
MKTQSVITIVTIPTGILGMLGAVLAIFYFIYTHNIQVSFEFFFYFFGAGLIAGILGLIIGFLFQSILY